MNRGREMKEEIWDDGSCERNGEVVDCPLRRFLSRFFVLQWSCARGDDLLFILFSCTLRSWPRLENCVNQKETEWCVINSPAMLGLASRCKLSIIVHCVEGEKRRERKVNSIRRGGVDDESNACRSQPSRSFVCRRPTI